MKACPKCEINEVDCLCAPLKTDKSNRRVPLRAGITDDRMYRRYDAGAGKTHTGYADWKRWQKENGFTCTG